MASPVVVDGGEKTLAGGSFFGAVQRKSEVQGAIFTDLQHAVPRKLPKHAHELPFFALLLRGYYGEQYGRERKQFSPFTVMFRPAGIPHQDEIGPQGLRFFEIELRPKWQVWIAGCSGNLRFACEDSRGGEMLWLTVRLFRELFGGVVADSFAVESLLAELVGYAGRLPKEETRQSPAWLARVMGKLQVEHCEKVTLDELSGEAGVHPVHLSRVFRRFVGEGIGEYVHRLRIRTACERLLAPEATLADVSFAVGFADQSHFCRVFRRITGMTPQTFRRSMRPSSETVV
jgi:AraC family transcriptional regulator